MNTLARVPVTGHRPPADPPPSGASLRIRLYETADSLDDLAGPWDALVEQAGASVFQTSAWARAWWEAFGHGKHWHVLGVWAGDRLVGLAPFCWERTRSGARRLRTLGSPEADYGGVVVAPELQDQTVQLLAEALYEDRSWDVIWLPEVPVDCATSHVFVTCLGGLGARVSQSIPHASRCWRIPLAGTWDGYLAGLHRQTRRRLLQKARRLERLGAQAIRADYSQDPDRGIDAFVHLHTFQWKRRGQKGAFARPGAIQFHQRLAAAAAERGLLDLWWLSCQGVPQAAAYDFRFGRSVYGYLAAFHPDGLRHFSPGLILTLWRIRAAIEDGYAWYDLLRGDEPYKKTLGARPYPNYTYEVVHSKRWRAWWYLALGPLRDLMLRKEAAASVRVSGAGAGAPDDGA